MTTELTGRRIVVVGGGMSGVAAAWALLGRGADVVVVERSSALGGRCASVPLGERVVTLGGKNVGRTYRRFRAFTEAMGDHPYEPFGINTARIVDGEVRPVDSERRARAALHLAGIGPADLVRLVRIARILRRDTEQRHLDSALTAQLGDRYGDRSLTDVFGARMVDVLLRSLTVRVSAAEPDEVPMRNAAPYLAMVLDGYDQLTHGVHRVFDDFARRCTVRLETTADELVVDGGRITGVRVSTAGGGETIDADGVVVAVPAPAATGLLDAVAPAAALAALERVRYFPVGIVVARYERDVFDPQARALVFGPESPLSNAGAYGRDDLDVVRYTFSGRAARALVAGEPSDERLVEVAEEALAPYMNVSGNRRTGFVARRYAHGLCAYAPDQPAVLAAARAVAGTPGVALAGDYLVGCSLEACCKSGEEAAAILATAGRRDRRAPVAA